MIKEGKCFVGFNVCLFCWLKIFDRFMWFVCGLIFVIFEIWFNVLCLFGRWLMWMIRLIVDVIWWWMELIGRLVFININNLRCWMIFWELLVCMVVIELLCLVFIVWIMLSVLFLWYLLMMIWFGCICSVFLMRFWIVYLFVFFMLGGLFFKVVICFWCSFNFVVFLIVMICFL